MERKKIFKIFGAFLAVMLIFTMLSQAVSGASMAKVETVRISTGTIEHKVSGSGRAQAGKEVAVFTEGGQRVKEICVKEGQAVAQGEVLFLLDMAELEEQVLAAQQELEKITLQNEDAERSKEQEQKQRELAKQRATEDYNQAVSKGDDDVAKAKAGWDAAQAALQQFLQDNPDPARYQTGQDEADLAFPQEGAVGEPEKIRPDATSGTSKTEQEQPDEGAGKEDGSASWAAQKSLLEQAAASAKTAYEESVASRAESVKSAARALEDAAMQQGTDSAVLQNEIAKKQQELALEKLKALQETEGKVTAPVSGVVTQVAVTTGDFTTEGTAIRLSDTSQGSQLVVPIGKSDEKYVQKGSAVAISVSEGSEKITDYTVSNIKENKEDSTLLDVIIDLPPGVMEPGALAEIEIVQKSKNYATLIPIQALREEDKKNFVLVLKEQQGVMGTELIASKVEVQVVDKNNTNAALEEGMLFGDQEIISNSSRFIEDGSRVRRGEE